MPHDTTASRTHSTLVAAADETADTILEPVRVYRSNDCSAFPLQWWKTFGEGVNPDISAALNRANASAAAGGVGSPTSCGGRTQS